jgi:hypothetical protein
VLEAQAVAARQARVRQEKKQVHHEEQLLMKREQCGKRCFVILALFVVL